MRGRTILLSLAFILLILISSSNAYRPVIDLGTLGGTQSWAYSINDNGQIVGYAYDSSGHRRACLFDSTGGGANIDLGTMNGYETGWARSINSFGQIVGRIEKNPINYQPPYSRACLFDNSGAGANQNLGFDGAWSINNKGNIVGATNNLACLYTTSNQIPSVINLGTFSGKEPESKMSFAYSINNNDNIIGEVIYGSDPQSYEYHACLFDKTGNGNNMNLGALGGFQSRAHSINDYDQIVGWAENGSGIPSACLFDITGEGANLDLGTIDNAPSVAYYINNNNQIVGQVGGKACLFDSSGQGNNVDLNSLINPSSGWTLKYAQGINNNGWIVGLGTNPEGQSRAFLLTPEPAMVLLFGLGAVALRKRK
jgi:probable HAF family extracellular repeat protein